MLHRALILNGFLNQDPLIVVRVTLMRESMKRTKRNNGNNDVAECNPFNEF